MKTSTIILILFLLGVGVLGYFWYFGDKTRPPVRAPAVMGSKILGDAVGHAFDVSEPGLVSGPQGSGLVGNKITGDIWEALKPADGGSGGVDRAPRWK